MLRSLFVIISLLIAAIPAFAAEEAQAPVRRIEEKIKVDGILNEAVWRTAPAIGGFTQVEPRSGAAAAESTSVWFATDGDSLYIAVRCSDRTPSIVATQMNRDGDLENNDNVEMVIDTFHDHRNAYYFATNPVGAFVDGRVTENQKVALEWDGIWNVRAAANEQGWAAEFEIPFKTLGFNPNEAEWGFNVQRFMARGRETTRWASPAVDVKFNQVVKAGNITGLEGLSQGVGLDVKSYAIAGFNRDITRADSFWATRTGGADIFYRVTSNIVSSTTFNTDFAETEADARQVNLTRFPTFFPEKRTFFLEDAGIFEFARPVEVRQGKSSDVMPFFSRRIGMLSGGEVPIRAGEKVTGKIGRFDFGLLDVQTGALEDASGARMVAGRNLAVARVKANFLSQSYIGAIFTNGDPTGRASNQTSGLDMTLATSNFLNRGKNLRLMAYGTKASTTGVDGRDMSYGGELAYPNDDLNLVTRWLKVGENYNPALGFVPRKGVRVWSSKAEVRRRPKSMGLRSATAEIQYDSYYSMPNHASETQQLRFVPAVLEFNSGDSVEYQLRWNRERLFKKWEVASGVMVPVGSYTFLAHNVKVESSPSRPVSVSLEGSTGDFYSGTKRTVTSEVSWRKNRNMATSMQVEQNWVKLKEGSFSTRLLLYKFDYAFTPLITLSNFIQYDTESRNIGLQSRFRWTMKPGNDLFLVLNHSWEENSFDRFEALQTRFRVKLNYTLRF